MLAPLESPLKHLGVVLVSDTITLDMLVPVKVEALSFDIISTQRHDLTSIHVTEQTLTERNKVRTTRAFTLTEPCRIMLSEGAHNETLISVGSALDVAFAVAAHVVGTLGDVVAILPATESVAAVCSRILLVFLGKSGEVDLDCVRDGAAVLVETDPGAKRLTDTRLV
jgi:hypothetical protein